MVYTGRAGGVGEALPKAGPAMIIDFHCHILPPDFADRHYELFRQCARSLFGQLRSSRRQVLAERQLHILDGLLDSGTMDADSLADLIRRHYADLKHPDRAWVRDMIELAEMEAVIWDDDLAISPNLDWPQQFSESELLERYEAMPVAVATRHPAMAALAQLLNRRR